MSKFHNYMVADLDVPTSLVLAAGNNAVKAIDCEVGSVVTLIFGVYRVEMVNGRKEFIKQRDLTATERMALGHNVRVQKPVNCDIHW